MTEKKLVVDLLELGEGQNWLDEMRAQRMEERRKEIREKNRKKYAEQQKANRNLSST